jgi:hypothetical protein
MTISLDWDDNAPAELVDHYNVYQTVDGGMQTKIGETTISSFDVVDPAPGNYVFNVSAVNLAGEGPQSDNVLGPAAPAKVLNVSISVS